MKRYNINDARVDNNDSIFVISTASRTMNKPTSIVLPHTSKNSGDTNSIMIPMTSNPIDLSMYAPKDELLSNTEFLKLVNQGLLVLMHSDEAEAILATPNGIAESDRLKAERLKALSRHTHEEEQESYTKAFPQEMMNLEKAAPGQVDKNMMGVSPAIVSIITDKGIDDAARAPMLRTYESQGLITARDRQCVRANSSDKAIRDIVA